MGREETRVQGLDYTILGRMEISRPLHRKAKILWQLENLQNYKDLYGKPLERDWRAKRLLLIQILLISNAHKNSPLKDINLKICMQAYLELFFSFLITLCITND